MNEYSRISKVHLAWEGRVTFPHLSSTLLLDGSIINPFTDLNQCASFYYHSIIKFIPTNPLALSHRDVRAPAKSNWIT